MLIKKSNKHIEKEVKMRLAERVKRVKDSLTMEFDKMVKEKIAADKKAGITDIKDRTIACAAGEPDFDPPQAAVRAVANALSTKGSNRYTPNKGKPELLAAIAEHIYNTRALDYEFASQVIATAGGKAACFLGLFSVVNPGDTVLIVRPYWTSYPDMVLMCGGQPVVVDWADLSNLDKLIAHHKNTRAIIINSPCNPTGQVLSAKQLAGIAQIVEQTDIWVISDEIYSPIVYEPNTHMSIAQFGNMQSHTLLIDGASKSFAMTGYRLGYALGPAELIAAMSKFQSQITSCACSLSQIAALEALRESHFAVAEMRDSYEYRLRNLILPFAQELNLQYAEPGGAFYFFFKIPNRNDCYNFCLELLLEKKVGLTPGIAFGQPGWIRLSYATAEDELAEALYRLKEFLISKK